MAPIGRSQVTNRDEITSRIVHRWPEDDGEKIVAD
jgi:hypothetical protein